VRQVGYLQEGCSKHVENWNKYILGRNCASGWLFTGTGG